MDGADTTFFGFDNEGNGLPNFFGTSAAAPDAAAVAALMIQAAGGPGHLSPDKLYQKIQATASPIALPDDRSWAAAFSGPLTFLAGNDWTRWNHFFNIQVSPFSGQKVKSIAFNGAATDLLWSLNPARFNVSDLEGIAASDMTVSTSADQLTFTINFAPGSFSRGDSVAFGMSLFTIALGSTQVTPDHLRGMTVTTTLEDGRKFTSPVFAGFKFPVNRFTGFGLVNADAAVRAVSRH